MERRIVVLGTLNTRARIGVVIPSTNTVVEAEYNLIRPADVSIHAARIYVPRPSVASDTETAQLLSDVRAGLPSAMRDLLTCVPDHVLLGMSAPTFYGGVRGMQSFEKELRRGVPVPVTSGARALAEALRTVGAKTIGVLSPYQPMNDKEVVTFFEESGYVISGYMSLKCPTAMAIAEVPKQDLVSAVTKLAAESPDAIIQVGTNLAVARLAGEAEHWLGIPVIAINTATLWFGLRSLGITDRRDDYGCLLREF